MLVDPAQSSTACSRLVICHTAGLALDGDISTKSSTEMLVGQHWWSARLIGNTRASIHYNKEIFKVAFKFGPLLKSKCL